MLTATHGLFSLAKLFFVSWWALLQYGCLAHFTGVNVPCWPFLLFVKQLFRRMKLEAASGNGFLQMSIPMRYQLHLVCKKDLNMYRSSHSEVFLERAIKSCSQNIQRIYRRTPMPKCNINKVVNCNFPYKFKSKCRRHFFNKVADFKPTTLLKKRLWHMCFSLGFEKF